MEGLEYEGEEYINRNDDNVSIAEPGDDEDEEDDEDEGGDEDDEDNDEDDDGDEDGDDEDKDKDDNNAEDGEDDEQDNENEYDNDNEEVDDDDDDDEVDPKYIDDVEDEDDVARGEDSDKERDDYLQTLLSTIEDNDRRQYLAQNPDEDADFVINSYEEEYRRQVQDNDHEYLFSLLETEDYEGDDGVDCWDPHRLQYEFERHYEWFMLESSLAESATPPPSAHDRE
jgi:hypothetical protein